MTIKEYLARQRAIVEHSLEDLIPRLGDGLKTHVESLNYSLKAGGKRIRPILCMATAEALGRDMNDIMAVPCALECIHTYSLIHDDLPAMDDDNLRRGKPTNHKIYGEAGAILAGDGLLTLAFELLSKSAPSWLSQSRQLQIIHLVAMAAGSLGMVGGQAQDIESEGKDIPFTVLQMIHRRKTGALITVAVQAGAILGGAAEKQFEALTRFGENLGLAFQIVDDLLNVLSTTEKLGKAAGSDAERQKATYPAILGITETKKRAQQAVKDALQALESFDYKADPLRHLAEYIYIRTH